MLEATGSFCATRQPVALDLALAAMGRFLALVPAAPSEALMSLAAASVETLDRFRAPMSDEERARRLAGPLSARQRELLEAWGYPYVFDEFRFHMTLTGALDEAGRHDAGRVLAPHLGRINLSPVLDSLCICVQPSPAERFRLLERFDLVAR